MTPIPTVLLFSSARHGRPVWQNILGQAVFRDFQRWQLGRRTLNRALKEDDGVVTESHSPITSSESAGLDHALCYYNSFLLLVAMPGAPSSFLAPSDAGHDLFRGTHL